MPIITKYRNGAPSWVEVTTSNSSAAVAFYTGLFGWHAADLGEEAGNYHMFSIDGVSVAGLGPKRCHGSVPVWSTYLAVDDLDATMARVAGAGGTVLVPRTEIVRSGSMAVAAGPTGAVVSFWQAGDHIGCQLVDEDHALAWSELTTRDAPVAMDFYRAVTGCEWVAMDPAVPDGYQLMMVGDRAVAGLMPMAGAAWGYMPSHWMPYFATPDADAAAARAVELGGAVATEPFDRAVGRTAVLTDPTGNAFSVIQPCGLPSRLECAQA